MQYAHDRRLGHPVARRFGGDPRERAERGVVVPLVAASMVAILLVATMVLDGSQAYPQRRSAQNAADAAAVAGAQGLDKARWFGGLPRIIYGRAWKVAAENGASRIDCTFIDGIGNPVADASGNTACTATTTVIPDAARGVRINAYVDRATTFAGIVGRDTVTAKATAAATVQKLKSTGSPFIVCANPAPSLAPPPGTTGFDVLRTNPAVITDWSAYSSPWNPPFVFNADGSVDLDPVKVATVNAMNSGRGMPLVGSEPRVPRCGLGGGNFDGNGGFETVVIPSWVGYTPGGGHSAAAAEQVVSTTPCPDPFPPNYDANAQPCDIVLPLAIDGDDDTNKLRVVSMAVFRVTGNGLGNPKYYGRIRSDIRYVAGGASSIDPVTAQSLRIVRLIQ